MINGYGLYEKDFLMGLSKGGLMLEIMIEGGFKSRIIPDPATPVDLPANPDLGAQAAQGVSL